MIYCFGSINRDIFYDVPHIPEPGETLAATGHDTGLGGKGANQSVAVARAGRHVVHLGAVGPDGRDLIDELQGFGVDISGIETVSHPTGHAIINVGADGENAIVLFAGANFQQNIEAIRAVLIKANAGDFLVLQNETSHVTEIAKIGQDLGLRVVYSAAPFDVESVRCVLPHIDMLAVNEVEAGQLQSAFDVELHELEVPQILITRGSKGAELLEANSRIMTEAPKVQVVDTTAAGDTFLGFFIAGLDSGDSPQMALDRAAKAAAVKVTKKGTADAIPEVSEIERFFA